MAEKHSNREESDSFEDDNSLDLSCGTSSFDESIFDDDQSTGIAPFRFEPYESDPSEKDSSDVDIVPDDMNRINNNNWCSCGNCSPMPTVQESVCCHEVERVKSISENLNDINCITSHPGFPPACLNTYVLQIAYFQYKQQYRDEIDDSSKKYRYTELCYLPVQYLAYETPSQVNLEITQDLNHINSQFD